MDQETVVNQKAVKMWPYIGHLVSRINEASESSSVEALLDVFVDAGKVVSKVRRDVTVGTLRDQLHRLLWFYKEEAKEVAKKKKKLQNPVGRWGKPLSASTLSQYNSSVKCWPRRRERMKRQIRGQLRELQALSETGGKIVNRGGVSLRVINGGRFPVHLAYRTGEDSWSRIR